MPKHPAPTAPRPRIAPPSFIIRRTGVASAAALAVGLLLGACDDALTTATASTTSPPSESRAAAFDHVGPQHGDEAGVVALAAAWDAAWNAGDADALAALFVEDAEFVNGRGQVVTGRAGIRNAHAFLFAGPFRGSRTESSIRRITFLSGTAAVLDLDNRLTGFAALPGGATPTEPGVNRGRHKRVAVKRAGTWRMVLMQITSVAPMQ